MDDQSDLNSPKTIAIGSKLELLIDDYLIDSMKDVSFVLHQPVPREVAIVHDATWEGGACAYHSVFRDGDRFRMYYRASPWRPGGFSHAVTCCAESSDGIKWERPDFGLFEFNGSLENNIILAPPLGLDNGRQIDDFTAFKDLNPEAPDSQRYKAICNVNWRTWGGGIWAFISADGVHWEKLREKPVLLDGKEYDGPQGPAFWDPYRGEYHAYLRAWVTNNGEELYKLGSNSLAAAEKKGLKDVRDLALFNNEPKPKDISQDMRVDPYGGVSAFRTVRHSTSDNFVNWSQPALLEFDTHLSMDEQIYTNTIQPYFRAPHIYIGLPKRFSPFRKKILKHPHMGISDGGFMSSRDGTHWKLWREAFIRPGLDPKNWLDRNTSPACGILETGFGEMSLYWTEHYNDDVCRVRRGTLRTDGFVSARAGYDHGEIVTKPLTFEGQELFINYSTSAFGSVQVELQDGLGSALKGYTLSQCRMIYGDDVEYKVCWNDGSDVSTLAGKPIRLRFILKDADLYSFKFGPFSPNDKCFGRT